MQLHWFPETFKRVLAAFIVVAAIIAPDVILNAVGAFLAVFFGDIVLHLFVGDRGRFFWTMHYISRVLLINVASNSIRILRQGTRSTTSAAGNRIDDFASALTKAENFSAAELLATVSVMLFYDYIRVAAKDVLLYVYDIYIVDESGSRKGDVTTPIRHAYSHSPAGSWKAFKETLRRDLKYSPQEWSDRCIEDDLGRRVSEMRDMKYGKTYFIRKRE